TLSFGHEGILYENSFVMYDRKTESLWVHVTGRAVWGPLKGKQLEFVPSTVTTWSQWKAAHPRTLVLPGFRRGGFMGTYHGLTRQYARSIPTARCTRRRGPAPVDEARRR